MVHAGIWPGQPPAVSEPEQLCALRRLPLDGRPFWYEVYTGPNMIVFGHTPSKHARLKHVDGRLVAAGLDTGCVYGGSLTAYSPELDAWLEVPAGGRAATATRERPRRRAALVVSVGLDAIG